MSKSKEQMIHEAAMELMQEVGVGVHNVRAVELLKKNGVRVDDDNIAYFTEEQVMHWVKMAPSEFTIYGRNPKYDMILGGWHVNPSPVYGCAFIDDWEGNRRPGTIEDYVKCVKLVHASDVYDIDGGIMIQPSEGEQTTAALRMFYATLTHSDKCIHIGTGMKEEMELALEAAAEVFGGKQAMIEKPRMITLINTVSPLTLDGRMLDCMMAMAEYGQPVILCPAAMLGATSSLTPAGTIASNAAETLAGIAIAQMVRPGTPCVYGVQSTAADMRGVTFACAAPEGALMQAYGATMARFYGLPSRGGGSQTDAPVINCQAGYESMLTFASAYSRGINIIMEAGGVMDSVNATSFEKMVIDFEIIRQVKAAFAPIEVNEETLNLEEIKEMGHDGSFLTADYTLDHFEDLYSPRVGMRGAKGHDYFKETIDDEIERLLDEYEDDHPTLDDEVNAKVKAILMRGGLEEAELDRIAAM